MLLKIGENDNSPNSIIVMVNYSYHDENRIITRYLPSMPFRRSSHEFCNKNDDTFYLRDIHKQYPSGFWNEWHSYHQTKGLQEMNQCCSTALYGGLTASSKQGLTYIPSKKQGIPFRCCHCDGFKLVTILIFQSGTEHHTGDYYTVAVGRELCCIVWSYC